jgi:hypothetical protein
MIGEDGSENRTYAVTRLTVRLPGGRPRRWSCLATPRRKRARPSGQLSERHSLRGLRKGDDAAENGLVGREGRDAEESTGLSLVEIPIHPPERERRFSRGDRARNSSRPGRKALLAPASFCHDRSRAFHPRSPGVVSFRPPDRPASSTLFRASWPSGQNANPSGISGTFCAAPGSSRTLRPFSFSGDAA